jgi:hypothetical protein
MAAIEVRAVTPECRNLKVVSLLMHHDDPKVRSDVVRSSKECLHLLRSCIRRDVVVVRFAAEQHVPHATTSIERHVSSVAEALDNPAGCEFEWWRHSLTLA